MELRQLEHFAAVAAEGHFTRAASQLHISQSALSSSIRALEREVGTALFERTTRRVLLTASGSVLLRYARRITGDVADARDALRQVSDGETGTVAIGTVQTFTAIDLPATLGRFHSAHPGVAVTLREGTTAELLDALVGGKLDLAFVALDAQPLEVGIFALATYTEKLTLAVAEGHPLAQRKSVSLSELADYPFIDFEAGRGLQTVVDALFDTARVDRDITFRISDMERLLGLVRHSLGVAIIPEPLARRHAGLSTVAIDVDPSPTRELTLACRTEEPTNSAARSFIRDLG